jgi:hypothetical protein
MARREGGPKDPEAGKRRCGKSDRKKLAGCFHTAKALPAEPRDTLKANVAVALILLWRRPRLAQVAQGHAVTWGMESGPTFLWAESNEVKAGGMALGYWSGIRGETGGTRVGRRRGQENR